MSDPSVDPEPIDPEDAPPTNDLEAFNRELLRGQVADARNQAQEASSSDPDLDSAWGPPTVAPTIDPDLDSAFGPPPQEQDQALRQAYQQGAGVNHEQEADKAKLADELGIDPAVLGKKFNEIKAAYEAKKLNTEQWRADNPGAAEAIAEHPEHAKTIVHDPEQNWLGKLLRAVVIAGERNEQGHMALEQEVFGGFDKWLFGLQPGKSTYDPKYPDTSKSVLETLFPTPEKVEMVVDPSAESGSTWEKVKAAYKQSDDNIAYGDLGFQMLLSWGTGHGLKPSLKAQADALKAGMAPRFYDAGPVEQLAIDGAEIAPSLKEIFKYEGLGAVAGGVALGGAALLLTKDKTAAANLGGLGVKYGRKVASGARAFSMESGSAFLEALDEKDDAGKPVDPTIAAGWALVYGGVAGVIEAEGEHEIGLFGPLGDAIRAGSAKVYLKKVLKDATAKAILKDIGKRWADHALGELKEESAQQAAQEFTSYLTRTQSAGTFQVPDLEGSAMAIGTSGGKALTGSAALAPVMGVFTAVQHVGSSKLAREVAEREAKKAGGIVDAATKSTTARAAPEVMAEIIEKESTASGEPITHLYVDPAAVVRRFQSEKKDPAVGATELMGPEGPKRLQEAVAQGSKLEVPVADYLKTWALHPAIGSTLKDDVTSRPELPTNNEIKEADPETKKRAKAMAEEAQAEEQVRQEADAKQAKLEAELVQLGHKPEDARVMVGLHRAFFGTADERNSKGILDDLGVQAEAGDEAPQTASPEEQLKEGLGELGPPLTNEQLLEALKREAPAKPQMREPGADDVEGAVPSEYADTSFDFGEKKPPSQEELGRATIERMRSPERQAQARAWFAYATKQTTERPEVPAAMRRELAKFGLVDPAGGFEQLPLDVATGANPDAGRTLGRTNGRANEQPEGLRREDDAHAYNKPRHNQPANALLSGTETLKKYGLEPGQRHTIRDVAEALERWMRKKSGVIARNDYSDEAKSKISDWMAEEVRFETLPQNKEKSGVGWYTSKFQKAIDIASEVHPELKKDKTARDMFTLLQAVTSDGQKVSRNFRAGLEMYQAFKDSGGKSIPVGKIGSQRQEGMDANFVRINQMLADMGPKKLHTFLLQERTVSELRQAAKASGRDFKTEFAADVKLPMAAVILGPKLGSFYANLMGKSGYLTMDRWWNRTFNRYRGVIADQPTRQGLDRFKELLGNKSMPDEEAMTRAEAYAQEYGRRDFKDGTEIEKAANTIYKAAALELLDAPKNAGERSFMIDTVKQAQAKLAEQGIDITVADIQAALWYYEKRLYAQLGAKDSADASYEDIAREFIGTNADQPEGRALRGDAGRPAQGPDGRVSGDGRGEPGAGPRRFQGPEAGAGADRVGPLWYSALQNAAAAAQRKSGNAQAWTNALLKAGVKQEEMDVVGLTKWLAAQKGEVSREAVADFVDTHQIKLEEKVKHETLITPAQRVEAKAHLKGFGIALHESQMGVDLEYLGSDGETYRDAESIIERLAEEGSLKPGDEGEIYNSLDTLNNNADSAGFVADTFYSRDSQFNTPGADPGTSHEVLLYIPGAKDFASGHFADEDAVGLSAHTRFHVNTLADGTKVMHVDEIQSDLHQKGKKQGYANPEAKKRALEAHERVKVADKALTEHLAQFTTLSHAKEMALDYARGLKPELSMYEEGSGAPAAAADPETPALAEALAQAYRERREAGEASKGIPDVAYKDTWEAMVVRRLIRFAAEKGFGKISWTTGATQAERYKQIKDVVQVNYHPDAKELDLHEADGEVTTHKDVAPKQLAGLLGKDVAEKLLSTPAEPAATVRPPPTDERSVRARQVLHEVEAKILAEGYPAKYGAPGARYPVTSISRRGDTLLLYWRKPGDTELSSISPMVPSAVRDMFPGDDERLKVALDYSGHGSFENVDHWTVYRRGEEVGADKSKERADKRAAMYGSRGSSHELSGLDIKVGGKGMVEAYDKRIPAIIEKLIKKSGGTVQKERLQSETHAPLKLEKYVVLQTPAGTWVVGEERGGIVGRGYADEAEARADAERMTQADKEAAAKAEAPAPGPEVWTATLPEALRSQVMRDGMPLFQENDDGVPRGYMYEASPADAAKAGLRRLFKIALNSKQDLSTFLHESGHVFLDLFAELAARPDAPEQVKADFAEAMKQLGVVDGEIKDEHHEKWARWFEAYLMEGKAPSEALKPAFDRFKLWLKNIYQTFTSLGAELSPEIRGVFDRMLATDAEIAQVKDRMGLKRLFSSPAEAGMSPSEWLNYLDAEEKATSRVAMQADLRALKDRQRTTEDWWKEEEGKLREQALKDYELIPARRVQRFLEGLRLNEDGTTQKETKPVKLDYDSVVRALQSWRKADLFHTAKDGTGAKPDEVNELFVDEKTGEKLFPTGAAMVQAIHALPADDKAAWAEATAKQKMQERHPDVLSDRQLMREQVEKGLHGDFTVRWLLRELAALAKRAAPAAAQAAGIFSGAPIEAIKQAAVQIVEGRLVAGLNPASALAQERSNADKCIRAVAKGDYAQAAVFKQKQILALQTHALLVEARDMRDGFLERAAKASKDKARAKLALANPTFIYRDAVDLLLEGFGVVAPREREGTLPALAAVVAQMEKGEASTIMFDVELLSNLLAQKKQWKSLTVAQLRELDAAVKNIQAAARHETTVLKNGQRVDAQEEENRLVAEARKNESDKSWMEASTDGARDWKQRWGARWNRFVGDLLQLRTMIHWLGGRALDSAWVQTILDPLQQSKRNEVDLLNSTIHPILEKFKAVPKETLKHFDDEVDGQALFPNHIADIPPPSRHYELLMMALNVGNAGNLERLTKGRNITEQQVMAALDKHLSKAEWEWVQSVWDAHQSLWPLAQALEERMSGLAPKAVKATPVVTRHGTFAGGYFPAIYDERSQAGKKQVGSAAAQFMDPTFTRPGTNHSHLKARSEGFFDAIDLDPSSVPTNLAKTAHDITHREAVTSVGKMLMRPEIQRVLRERMGPERVASFLQWVKDVGQMGRGQGQDDMHAFTKMAKALKANTVIGALGYSATNMVEDASNLPAAVARTDLKSKYLMGALFEYVGSPVTGTKLDAWAHEKSGELRSRRDQLLRELTREIRKIDAKGVFKTGPLEAVKHHAFAMMEFSDRVTSTSIWVGRYRQAVAEGHTDAEAIGLADNVVQQIFPSHAAVDLAPLLRNKGAIGHLLQFGGFVNVVFNSQADLFHQMTRADPSLSKGSDAVRRAKVAGKYLGYLFSVGVLGALLKRRGPDKDEDPYAWATRELALTSLASVPFGGDAGNAIQSMWKGKTPNVRNSTPVGLLGELMLSGVDLGRTLSDEKRRNKPGLDKKIYRLLQASMPLHGLPTAQPLRTSRYLIDLYSGKLPEQSLIDYPLGLYGGQRPEQKRKQK